MRHLASFGRRHKCLKINGFLLQLGYSCPNWAGKSK
jgi:hypothetical protein